MPRARGLATALRSPRRRAGELAAAARTQPPSIPAQLPRRSGTTAGALVAARRGHCWRPEIPPAGTLAASALRCVEEATGKILRRPSKAFAIQACGRTRPWQILVRQGCRGRCGRHAHHLATGEFFNGPLGVPSPRVNVLSHGCQGQLHNIVLQG